MVVGFPCTQVVFSYTLDGWKEMIGEIAETAGLTARPCPVETGQVTSDLRYALFNTI